MEFQERVEHGTDERDAGEDVEDGEQLRGVGAGCEVAESDGREGHRTEVERIHPTPILDEVVYHRAHGEDKKRQPGNVPEGVLVPFLTCGSFLSLSLRGVRGCLVAAQQK